MSCFKGTSEQGQNAWTRFEENFETYLYQLGCYIEQNPVRAGLAEHASEWQWSSVRAYYSGESDGIVDPGKHPCLPVEFANAGERQRWFRDYFQELPEGDLKTFRSEATVIGDLSFRAKLASVMGRLQIRRGRLRKNKEGQ